MKKILILCVASFVLLTGCNGNTSTQSSEIEPPIPTHKTTEEPSLENDNNSVNFDASDLCGTWMSPNGAPLIINSDGTAESVAVKSKGTYTLNGNELVIYWSEYNKKETYRVEEKNGELSIIYGSEPLVCVYNKK